MKDSQLNPTLKPLECPILEADDDLEIILDTESQDDDSLSCSCFVIDFKALTIFPKEDQRQREVSRSPKQQRTTHKSDFNWKSSFAQADVSTTRSFH